MEFVLTFQQPAHVFRDEGAAMPEAWERYMNDMASAGVIRGGHRLAALDCATVRVRDEQLALDRAAGGNADLLGGYVVIDVPSLDEAVKWAGRSPAARTGSTGVHAVMAMPE